MSFDNYTLKARLAPAVLAGLPALALLGAAAFSPERVIRVSGLLLGAVGLVICGLVRDAGRRIQPALWESWGGSPTLRRLRWRDGDDQTAVGRLHDRLNTLLDSPLPDAAAEAANPASADRQYDEAVGVLRQRTREDRTRFKLVFAENVEYGFRRNCLGIRRLAISVALVALAIGLGLMAFGPGSLDSRALRWGVCAAVSGTAGLFWWRTVAPGWARQAAELYADRLYEAVDTLRRQP